MIEEVIGLQIRVKWLSLDWNPGLYSTKVQVLHHNTNQFGGEEWGVRVVTKIDKTKQKKQKPNLFDIVHTSYRNRTSLSLKVRKIIYHLIKKKMSTGGREPRSKVHSAFYNLEEKLLQ